VSEKKQPKQIYWRRNEIPNAEYLMQHVDALREDFMRGFDQLKDAARAHTNPVLDRRHLGIPLEVSSQWITTNNKPNVQAWRSAQLRYERHDDLLDVSFTAPQSFAEKFPTAWKLIQEYGDDCPICSYSVLAPKSRIERHTGPENRTGEFIRVHVPLIIPEGDCFFEANGEEIDWSDIWAFHNQIAHSAHNNTNQWRLVFLIDFRRTAIGMEPGEPFDESFDEFHVEPFVRKPKEITNIS